MAKSFTASASQLKPDARFGSLLASKFINCMMRDGKKGVAMLRFYEALDIIKEKNPEESPIDVFQRAVDNVKPSIEVRSKRVGGATYQVPTPVNSKRQQTLAIRWILAAARGPQQLGRGQGQLEGRGARHRDAGDGVGPRAVEFGVDHAG